MHVYDERISESLMNMTTDHPLGEVLVVDDDPIILGVLEKALAGIGYLVSTATNALAALRRIDRCVPEVIVTDLYMPGMDGTAFCRKVRKNPKSSGVPIIMISIATQLKVRLDGFRAGADDYISKPFHMPEVKARLDRLVSRNQRALSSNPLSGLPGNPSIEVEVNRRLAEGKPFAFAYIDIDDFKAFNDVYGYQSGDQVLKDLASLLVSASSSVSAGTFVGHVGGDDFVIIDTAKHMRATMKVVLEGFDREARGYYTSKDKERGGLVTSNRQYRKQFFPMMKLSCAVIDTGIRTIHHYAELVEIATELKHHLKSLDRRRKSLAQWNGRLQRKSPSQRTVLKKLLHRQLVLT